MTGWSWLEELVRRARDAGVDLTGPGGLLKSLTRLVNGDRARGGGEPRTAGVDEHAVQGRNRGNSRNGKRVRDGAH